MDAANKNVDVVMRINFGDGRVSAPSLDAAALLWNMRAMANAQLVPSHTYWIEVLASDGWHFCFCD